jgi:hypothetical protein
MTTNRLQITELDFDQIKTNLKSYLKQQSEFQDYDFEGAGLSVLVDLLAYNTHYNAYYLNMVANESFMDTAILRDSVVSHAKSLGYIPYSYSAPVASINITVTTENTTPGQLTLPKGFIFLSNLIDGTSYSFVTLEPYTVTKSGTNFYFENVDIYEGQILSYNYNYTELDNPKAIFSIPETTIDTNTITVSVKPNSSNTQYTVYSKATDILEITSASEVFFLQEGRNGRYEIYFGDGVIGKKLNDGAVVTISYLTTNGDLANKADNFTGTSNIDVYSQYSIFVNNVASGGKLRQSVDKIKTGALSQYATQNRLVTTKDYESYILNNYPNIDAISVWGGQDETPKVFGKVYISLKPKKDYYISETEKQRIVDVIINPKAIVSVQAEIRDPEYLYLIVQNNIQYDPKKTVTDAESLKNSIKAAILNYRDTQLNNFSSYFVVSELQDTINYVDMNAIIGSEITVRVQKRFVPKLNQSTSYNIKYNCPIHRGTITNKLISTEFDVYDVTGTRRTATFEEAPQSYTGISQIQITSPGSGYSSPTVTITGDGSGATAYAKVINGRIQSIVITNRGTDYTRATVTISDETGYGAAVVAVIDGKVGTLRTIYYDSLAQRQIINSNAGTIDYESGIIYINDIRFLSTNSTDGLIRLNIEAERGIIKSVRNTILTIDDNDPTSITTTLEKSNK